MTIHADKIVDGRLVPASERRQCIEDVCRKVRSIIGDGSAYQWGRCRRYAGHGYGGRYCKQHARKHRTSEPIWEPFQRLPIPADDRIPEGHCLIVAYGHNDEVVVPVDPTLIPGEDWEDKHSCDWEKCGSLSHVVRFSVTRKYATEDRLSEAVALLREATVKMEAHKVPPTNLLRRIDAFLKMED